MRRERVAPREGWQDIVIKQGLSFPVTPKDDGTIIPYWADDTCYSFTLAEIEVLEETAAQLHSMCVAAAEHLLKTGDIEKFGIPSEALPLLRWAYETKQVSIYGRFDVAWDGTGSPKLLEYNGDTPTGLIESAVCQWHWLEDQKPGADQFNSLHERLVEAWKRASTRLPIVGVHFAFVDDGEEGEDWVTCAYMRDVATEAGMATHGIQMSDIGWDPSQERFVDLDGKLLATVWKLYPWEDMLQEQFASRLWESRELTRWIEPAWKVLLSNKAMLAVLWELYPDHELLLPAYLDGPRGMTEYVSKPLHGREGNGVTVHRGETQETSPIPHRYGDEGYCYQQYTPLPDFDGSKPVLGLWIVDGLPAGMGIREQDGLITDYWARFTPHYISDAEAPSAEQMREWIDEDYRP